MDVNEWNINGCSECMISHLNLSNDSFVPTSDRAIWIEKKFSKRPSLKLFAQDLLKLEKAIFSDCISLLT